MQISWNWIREYVDVDASPSEAAQGLTMAGIEVEGVHDRYPDLKGVIVAHVEEVLPHPDADKLRICRVATGSGLMDIVCGAPNVASGQRVPLALEGAVLPGGIKVKRAKIRGVASSGMICSEVELGVGDDASGIMVLDQDAPIGVPLSQVLPLDDAILEVSVTPNRPDCMNAIGVAREVAALFGKKLRIPDVSMPETGPPAREQTSVTLEDPHGCPRYAARLVRGIRIAPSPYWLRQRLLSTGIRSINNVVDVTNYVLMEFGQPLHAFDFNRLEEHRIVVRDAQQGDLFTTLDDVERVLPRGAVMICDGKKPVALAGIMGGLNSEIFDSTEDVLIESAYFDPVSIRRTSKHLGLSTEASVRFERGTDPEGVIRAADRAAQLIVELAGGEAAAGVVDEYPRPFQRRVLPLNVDKTNRFLGTDLSAGEMKACLSAIELDVREKEPGRLEVTCPLLRPDLEREVDLMEEVARLHGYDRIPVTYPPPAEAGKPIDSGRRARIEAVRLACSAGYTEVINYSFVPQDVFDKCGLDAQDPRRRCIPILNPLSEEQSLMRSSLLPGLLYTIQRNVSFRNNDLRLFELGKVYLPDGSESPSQECHRAAGVHTGLRESPVWCREPAAVDFLDIKGAVTLLLDAFRVPSPAFERETEDPLFAPEEAARVLIQDRPAGVLGRVSQQVLQRFDIPGRVYAFELDFDLMSSSGWGPIAVEALPKFPAVVRDLALVVPRNLEAGRLTQVISEHAQKKTVETIRLFDVYQGDRIGKDEVSLAYRVTYRSKDKTLSDEAVNRMHEKLIQAVLADTGGRLRE